jgi:hypothetical protein
MRWTPDPQVNLVKLGAQPTNANTASGMSRMKNFKKIAKIDSYQGTQKQMNYL